MLFWKKSKKVVLRCITAVQGLDQLYPPARLPKYIPDWWKKAPAFNEPVIDEKRYSPSKMRKTVKHCYAIQKLLERGIALPMWSDAYVMVKSDGEPRAVTPSGRTGTHHPERQYPGMLAPSWVNYKLESPWLFYTEEPVHWAMVNPFYHIKDHMWQAMPGVTEFFYQHHTHTNIVFRRPAGAIAHEYEFRPGDIVAYFVPMFEADVEVAVEVVSDEEMRKLEFGTKIWFNSADGHRDNNIGGCPLSR